MRVGVHERIFVVFHPFWLLLCMIESSRDPLIDLTVCRANHALEWDEQSHDCVGYMRQRDRKARQHKKDELEHSSIYVLSLFCFRFSFGIYSPLMTCIFSLLLAFIYNIVFS